jgi:hypothetical protein
MKGIAKEEAMAYFRMILLLLTAGGTRKQYR